MFKGNNFMRKTRKTQKKMKKKSKKDGFISIFHLKLVFLH